MKDVPKIFLLIEQSRAFGRELLRGISRYAQIHGPWLFITKHDFYYGGGSSSSSGLEDIEGAIIREAPLREMRKVLDLGVPTIVSNHLTTSLAWPHIITNCARIGQMGASHFLDCGFRHLAFCRSGDLYWSERRCNSFVEAVAQAGHDTHVYKLPSRRAHQQWHVEQRLLADWLTALPKPVGVMAPTDDRALELVAACDAAGVKVPEEVAILGVDNDDLVCNMATVPISSVALDVKQAGYDAAALLHKLMKGKNPGRQEILVRPTHIEARRSTDISALEDTAVAEAVRFIHNKVHQPLQVADVARHVSVSQRSLFERFHRTLGKSVFEEITRVRIAKIAWLLETTPLSIKEISEIMNMPDETHLSRYFLARKGVSPIAWRKQVQSHP